VRGQVTHKDMPRPVSNLAQILCSRALAFLLAVAPGAHAARPFVTDDARIVEQGHCQLETFGKRQSAYAGSEFWFLPACNPSFVPLPYGAELTLGRNRIEDEYNTILQAKFLLKPLEENGFGYAASLGSFGGDPYVNGIASFSFLDDRAVVHTNLGMIRNRDADRATWGLGLEALLFAPRWYAILEGFGQRGDKPTLHLGLRFWVIPNRLQIDATHGYQSSDPAKRFNTLGLRVIF
jgi:hypothetical protein